MYIKKTKKQKNNNNNNDNNNNNTSSSSSNNNNNNNNNNKHQQTSTALNHQLSVLTLWHHEQIWTLEHLFELWKNKHHHRRPQRVKKRDSVKLPFRKRTWMYSSGVHLRQIVPQSGLPSGKHTKNYGKSPCSMGKLTISMAIFNSYVSHYQRVIIQPQLLNCDFPKGMIR